MNIGEFFVTLGVDADTPKVKDFVKTIADLPLETVGAIAALGGISFELSRIAEKSVEAAIGLQGFANQTGLSTQELQMWEHIAVQANVSAETMASSIESLQRNLAEIRLGRGNVAPFQLLGISANQDAFSVVQQLRSKIHGLDKATATNLVSQMGLSPEMMNVLTLSERQFREYSQVVGNMNQAQVDGFLKAKLAATQFGLVVRDLGMNLLFNLGSAISTILGKISDMKYGLQTMAAIAAGLAIAFAPLTSALVLLVLVLEDISVYFAGGKSITGELLDFLEKLSGKFKLPSGLAGFGSQALGAVPVVGGALQAGAAAAKAIVQNVKVDVHVIGEDAVDIARKVKHEIERGISAATLQANNQGH